MGLGRVIPDEAVGGERDVVHPLDQPGRPLRVLDRPPLRRDHLEIARRREDEERRVVEARLAELIVGTAGGVERQAIDLDVVGDGAVRLAGALDQVFDAALDIRERHKVAGVLHHVGEIARPESGVVGLAVGRVEERAVGRPHDAAVEELARRVFEEGDVGTDARVDGVDGGCGRRGGRLLDRRDGRFFLASGRSRDGRNRGSGGFGRCYGGSGGYGGSNRGHGFLGGSHGWGNCRGLFFRNRRGRLGRNRRGGRDSCRDWRRFRFRLGPFPAFFPALDERTIEPRPERLLAQEHGLQEAEAVGEIALVAGRLALPVRPVDALAAGVAHAVLELAAPLALEHGPQDHVGPGGQVAVAEDIVRHQEMKDVAGRDAAVHVPAEGVRAVLALRDADGVGLEIIAPPHRDEHGRDAEVEALEADLVHLLPEAVENAAPLDGIDQAVFDGQAVEGRRGVVVELAVATLPPGEPVGPRIVEGRGVHGLEAGSEAGVDGGLGGAAELALEVGERAPGTVDQGVGVAVLVAAVEGVPPGVGAVGLDERAAVAALRCLDEAVPVDVAAGQEVGDELEALDAAGEPVEVARRFDVVPGGNERRGLGVEEVAVVPVAGDLAGQGGGGGGGGRRGGWTGGRGGRGGGGSGRAGGGGGGAAHAVIEPVIDRAADERHEGDARGDVGREEGLVGVEPERDAGRAADDVVAEDAGRRAERLVLFAPAGAGLKGVEPAAAGREPEVGGAEAGGRGEDERRKGQGEGGEAGWGGGGGTGRGSGGGGWGGGDVREIDDEIDDFIGAAAFEPADDVGGGGDVGGGRSGRRGGGGPGRGRRSGRDGWRGTGGAGGGGTCWGLDGQKHRAEVGSVDHGGQAESAVIEPIGREHGRRRDRGVERKDEAKRRGGRGRGARGDRGGSGGGSEGRAGG